MTTSWTKNKGYIKSLGQNFKFFDIEKHEDSKFLFVFTQILDKCGWVVLKKDDLIFCP